MKKIWILAAAATAVSAAACSGGGGSKGLSSGTYVVSNSTLSPDECMVSPQLADNDTVNITVSGNTVTLGSIDFTKSGNSLTTPPNVVPIDWTDSAGSGLTHAYNCMESDTYTFAGTISGSTLHLTADTVYDMSAGSSASECIAANDSAFGLVLTVFPCHSLESYDLNKQ